MDDHHAGELRQVWDLLEVAAPDHSDVDVSGAWVEFLSETDGSRDSIDEQAAARVTPIQGTMLRLVSHPTMMRYAAAIAFVAVAGTAFLGFKPRVFSAAPGAQAHYALADGSSVMLNSDSRLTVAGPFTRLIRPEAARHVRLEGEGFFDVVPGRGTFSVTTFNARVTVLGTQFDVRAYRDGFDDRTDLVVTEGRVRFESVDSVTPDAVELTGGMGSRLNAGAVVPVPPAPVDAARATSWQLQSFALVEQPLGVVFAEMERRFGISIDVRSGVDVTRRKTLLYSSDRTPESILDDLGQSEGFRFRPVLKGYEILPAR